MNPKIQLELVIWTLALLMLALSDPSVDHYTLCPLANLGFTWCPGCGLGHSITALFHFQITNSFQYHWFGIPATLILLNRMWQLSRKLIVN